MNPHSKQCSGSAHLCQITVHMTMRLTPSTFPGLDTTPSLSWALWHSWARHHTRCFAYISHNSQYQVEKPRHGGVKWLGQVPWSVDHCLGFTFFLARDMFPLIFLRCLLMDITPLGSIRASYWPHTVASESLDSAFWVLSSTPNWAT